MFQIFDAIAISEDDRMRLTGGALMPAATRHLALPDIPTTTSTSNGRAAREAGSSRAAKAA